VFEGITNTANKKIPRTWLDDGKRLQKESAVNERGGSMNANLVLEASQSTKTVRLNLDLSISLASIAFIFSRLF